MEDNKSMEDNIKEIIEVQMEAQLEEMKVQLEEMNYKLKAQMEDQMKVFEDFDRRLKNLEEKNIMPSCFSVSTKNKEETESHNDISFDVYKKGVCISGDTKPYKDIIKGLGAKWNPTLVAWIATNKTGLKCFSFFENMEDVRLTETEEFKKLKD